MSRRRLEARDFKSDRAGSLLTANAAKISCLQQCFGQVPYRDPILLSVGSDQLCMRLDLFSVDCVRNSSRFPPLFGRLRLIFGRILPVLGWLQAILVWFRPIFGRLRPIFSRARPKLARVRPTSAWCLPILSISSRIELVSANFVPASNLSCCRPITGWLRGYSVSLCLFCKAMCPLAALYG